LGFVLVGCAVAASEVAMAFATQRTAPAHLVQITLEHPRLLKAARLKNDSDKLITSYRIGWANIRPNGIEMRQGTLTSVPRGINPGDVHVVSDQSVPFDESIQSIIFLVAEVNFADGNHWHVQIEDIAHEAGLFSKLTADGR
jgi:hypothetical protein